ncbi:MULTISPECIES: bifunctional [glutamine synthetase] adenylyltransferase/[glutamine synthetase]-adenylyl-L-tyrosine phosphorylase [unclassified Microbacterium]|uniref:bifunctional [glutamine synthetase] adenylyltransferase/[glutamine synthetase]-adenylyl-L-tyrosine phosphorylase n=1 Tax=unclassified Microbacterium TaxID=2609290 RepID=UPI000EA89F1B|nr:MULTISPECIES: bifunctional [glutamine synthetase] adenylyltransferase/[glutamine synthetase]-adenylyl-L-tyrosine phosphorylase [unclassified Microbacterium]MBT2486069.1 bifunctional [glutamine synthetase] adenylyltransferase/[glutamine synthetase]-adenylyl-L-tyrosine phosphorylase [Microbacterium sp. ISL-108]RKN68804.1 bifunctional [glutamine synthetase] adenylyltransferase/[glutamine synthetase]-adenylyl-L-tyrosine phosphorylase [Microbacterium sp. CGR2]
MARPDDSVSLSALARLGFAELSEAAASLAELANLVERPRPSVLDGASAADPDAAVRGMVRVARRDPVPLRALLDDADSRRRVWRVFGASEGLADFFLRHPEQLSVLGESNSSLPTEQMLRERMLAAVGVERGFARAGDDDAVVAIRVAYRRSLAAIAAYDLTHPSPEVVVGDVAAALADAAGAALEASLAVARTRLRETIPEHEIAATRLSVIGMGKAGARELNYVSDVDVIFVGGSSDEEAVGEARAIEIATRLARETMRGLSGIEVEPPLWEVDANLRPEGKQGALVRSLPSHLAYYERWAKSWEFQALLKARPLAGDPQLGADYIAAVQPKIWSSAARDDFVESVQRMRERVTEHIDAEDAPYQLKLGAGGLRDIEFTVQLLQLVHGLTDETIRTRGTLESLDSLVAGGYIGRADAGSFAEDYRVLRLMEHRLQLRELSRTHLMPRTPAGLRVLARSSGLAETGEGVWARWEKVRREVREIHTRLFYRPLLSAVAGLPEEERTLSAAQAHDRLAAIGFRDPAGALRHIGALTSGLSRKTTIQRHLMPIMVRWFADGSDPDYGLIAFRRISERLGDTPWFLRVLRDSSGAAESLTRLLSSSRYVGELMEWIPESVAWLDNRERLRPRGAAALDEEARAIQTRHETVGDALRAVRALRRRELLRTAMGAVLDVLTIEEVATALTEITEATIQAALRAVVREVVPPEDAALDFAIIAMGRFGGAELGFGSDADILYVYDANGIDGQRAQTLATQIVAGLREHLTDHRVPLDLDADLRPEGRQGPVVRSIEAYTAYYRRWSLSWEAQALLRARGVAGSARLIARFTELADSIRYPEDVDLQGTREIKRIKARVEGERLPQGADPRRHLKLGPGTLSDVEWLVQLLQLQHAHHEPRLQTTSTLSALEAAVDAGLVPEDDAERLREAWRLASRLRSAITLLTGQTSDVLPADRRQLDAIGRLLGYPDRSATDLEEDYLGVTRRARKSFEHLFYG